MYKRSGSARFVICFPKLGLAVKFIKIKPVLFFQELYCLVVDRLQSRKEGLEEINYTRLKLKRFFWFSKEYAAGHYTIRNTLLNGIVDNFLEFYIWRKTKSEFLQPTYFSFFGLINFQRFGEPLKTKNRISHWMHNGLMWKDGHHFGANENYCIINDGVKMIDYGSDIVLDLLINHSEDMKGWFCILGNKLIEEGD